MLAGAAKATATYEQRLRLADALPVYLSAVEPLRSMTADETYHQMARLLVSARDCHERLGSSAEFTRHLAAIRSASATR